MDPIELADYLDAVFGRLVDHRFASDVDVSDVGAPSGANVIMTSNPSEHRVYEARVFVDPPLPVDDLVAVVDRRIDVDDGSSRLLLAPTTQYVGANGPSRVTVGLPTDVLDAGDPIAQFSIMFPDQFTSPTGVVMGMSVSGDWETRTDLLSVLAPDSTLRRLHDLLGGHDDITGLLWCDDAADMFGTHRRGDTRYGMAPHFIPILSVGVDFVTLGLLWDRPETGLLDDTTLYAVSPGDNYRLDSRLSLKGWIAGHVRTELESATGERADRLGEVLDVVGKRTKSATLGFGGGVKRPKPRDLEAGEQWKPFVHGGDGVRAPAESFGKGRLTTCSNAWKGVEASRVAMDAGVAGNALHAAGTGLAQATGHQDAAAIQAIYHAMIEPLEALGRTAIADRCRALTTVVVPIMNDQPKPPDPRPPLWSVPMATASEVDRVTCDVVGIEGQGEPMTVPYSGRNVSVDVTGFAPLELESLPGAVVIDLLDSGAVAVGPDGTLASEHGKPIVGARSSDVLVVASVWEQPSDIEYRVECVIDWADDAQRYRLVQYAPLQLSWDPFGTGTSSAPLTFARAPAESSADALQQAGPLGSPDALRLDVLRSYTQMNGLVLSERAAAVLAPGLEHRPLAVEADGAELSMRYLPTTDAEIVEWEHSTFAVVAGSMTLEIVERLHGPHGLDSLQTMNAEFAQQTGPRRTACLNVAVLAEAPPVVRLFETGLLVRSDIRDAVDAAGLIGFQMGRRSDFYVTPVR